MSEQDAQVLWELYTAHREGIESACPELSNTGSSYSWPPSWHDVSDLNRAALTLAVQDFKAMTLGLPTEGAEA